ncbi:FAD-binding oxidoreductase [Bordetella bronchialis]|uniref:D-lactate dehydrogenase (cytochrome) n=1 Tax=Bordetella bronchialis TaxID=463025 RepID=A0ABM6CUF4_9BORD|nr:FAD-linked oxidase C-terminal domain-containing protein [Bordetella bronchialis]ANN67724.1 2-hydroxy-acid oxidase [Bordetella bronchialis]
MNDLTDPAWLRRPVPAACLESLRAIVGDRLSTARAVREHHGHDESPYPDVLPDAVIFAETTDEVAAVARVCNDHRVPIVAYGAGSSLEGHLLPVQGGITLDLSRMNAVLAVHAEDFTATVQAGVTRKQLNEHLRDSGLFFPVDPGADASLGGMAATRASGTNAVRYGTMRENVLSLTVVTADGRVLRTARRAPKSAAGYDLTRIFVGSEGTLGIITEVTVKLYPQPEAVSAAVCNFPTLGDAVDSVIEIMQAGVPVARVEFMDEHAVRSVNRYSQLTLRETPLLLFEFHGSAGGVQEQAAAVQAIVHEHGGMDFEWAHRPEDRSRLWAARHNAYFAGLQLRPGCRSSTTDVCVPISALAECVRETARDLAEAPFPTTIVGHVGDGNFHVLMLLDPDSQEEWDASERINHALVRRAIAADGTCTGEHGVGLHKMGFLLEEHGKDALDLMRSLKHAFDPNNILNPGKIVSW